MICCLLHSFKSTLCHFNLICLQSAEPCVLTSTHVCTAYSKMLLPDVRCRLVRHVCKLDHSRVTTCPSILPHLSLPRHTPRKSNLELNFRQIHPFTLTKIPRPLYSVLHTETRHLCSGRALGTVNYVQQQPCNPLSVRSATINSTKIHKNNIIKLVPGLLFAATKIPLFVLHRSRALRSIKPARSRAYFYLSRFWQKKILHRSHIYWQHLPHFFCADFRTTVPVSNFFASHS